MSAAAGPASPAGASVERIPVVGVMGSGRDPHSEIAAPVGRFLAERGVHLLTGGGRGVMTEVARAFCQVTPRRGLSLGILPARSADDPRPVDGYPNPFVEVPIHTHLPLRGPSGDQAGSRNAINVLSSDVVVALPGGAGTRSEITLALRFRRPLVVYQPANLDGLPPDANVARDLESLRSFVDEALGRAGSD